MTRALRANASPSMAASPAEVVEALDGILPARATSLVLDRRGPYAECSRTRPRRWGSSTIDIVT